LTFALVRPIFGHFFEGATTVGVPKKRTSKMRRDRRRAANSKMTAANVVSCPKCREPILPHTVCKNCGTYKKRTALAVSE
jgi:large subunit ribosomal protein L32